MSSARQRLACFDARRATKAARAAALVFQREIQSGKRRSFRGSVAALLSSPMHSIGCKVQVGCFRGELCRVAFRSELEERHDKLDEEIGVVERGCQSNNTAHAPCSNGDFESIERCSCQSDHCRDVERPSVQRQREANWEAQVASSERIGAKRLESNKLFLFGLFCFPPLWTFFPSRRSLVGVPFFPSSAPLRFCSRDRAPLVLRRETKLLVSSGCFSTVFFLTSKARSSLDRKINQPSLSQGGARRSRRLCSRPGGRPSLRRPPLPGQSPSTGAAC